MRVAYANNAPWCWGPSGRFPSLPLVFLREFEAVRHETGDREMMHADGLAIARHREAIRPTGQGGLFTQPDAYRPTDVVETGETL